MLLHELTQGRHRARSRNRVGVRNEHELAGGRGDAVVEIGGEAQRAGVVVNADAVVARGRTARYVGDHDHLVDLRYERRQRPLELGRVPVRDDDRRDPHPAISR
jgi:hypothetical protein